MQLQVKLYEGIFSLIQEQIHVAHPTTSEKIVDVTQETLKNTTQRLADEIQFP